MADYRIYSLTEAGKIGFADWIRASTDEQAIARARNMRPSAHKCELWLESRLVAILNTEGQLETLPA